MTLVDTKSRDGVGTSQKQNFMFNDFIKNALKSKK